MPARKRPFTGLLKTPIYLDDAKAGWLKREFALRRDTPLLVRNTESESSRLINFLELILIAPIVGNGGSRPFWRLQ